LANCWGDLDNDGYQDVLITTDGSPTISLYYNQKDGTFANLTVAGTAGANACGIALADYDNDGELDFYTNGANEARSLFHNNLIFNYHWAEFSLQGTSSNRAAIGAELRLKAVLAGDPTWQLRQVVAHNSFQSQNDLRQHFGLNEATQIDSVIVRWPSGLVEAFSGLATDNFYKLVEGQGITVTTGTAEPAAAANRVLNILPNPSAGEFQVWCGDGPKEQISAIEVFDSTGRIIHCDLTWAGNRVQASIPLGLPAGLFFVRAFFADGGTGIGQVSKY
ncbi:MAG: ASPIC/UnbV domain-containing protein, partial [Saprospiraceae bacterium]